jgi:hypothetical protein
MEVSGGGVIEDCLHPEWANIRMSLDTPWAFGASRETARVLDGRAIIHGATRTVTFIRGYEGRSFGIGILPSGWNLLWASRPKSLLRRQRFLRMLGTLHVRPYSEWGDFLDPQYVDQSHMVRARPLHPARRDQSTRSSVWPTAARPALAAKPGPMPRTM